MSGLRLSLALMVSPLLACAGQSSRIVVDDAHSQMQKVGVSNPEIYEIVAGDSVEIDASSYAFIVPERMKGKLVNSVQIVLSDERNYSADWRQSQRRLVLSRESLRPNAGSIPFDGFIRGEDGVVAIGNLEGSTFSVFWVGSFSVK